MCDVTGVRLSEFVFPRPRGNVYGAFEDFGARRAQCLMFAGYGPCNAAHDSACMTHTLSLW
jgi:hypothetical protein